ncbi:MAG: SprB repeat-containing protein, partial [Phycisphaerae bacterium]|nr:SprB repeat-containing protein [Saprospiraceae bacterium]
MKKSLLSAIILTLLASASVASAQIQMTFSIVQPTCHGFTNGSATVFPVGGSNPYTYVWSTGQTSQTTFGIGKGTYTVTVTDALLNSATGQISVLEPSAVLASITATNVNCAGNNGTLTANGFGGTPPYTYAWNGPGGTSLFKAIPVVAPGNYFLTVTDANNCSGIESFTVDALLTVEVTATDIPCSIYPQGGSANAVATGGKTPYAYSWSNGAHTSFITNISQGLYICTVTSANGCTATDSDYVDMPPPLEVVITWLTPSCGFSNNGTATVQASGGTPPYTYNWPNNLPSGPSQTGLPPGLYYVCTFDSNQCQMDLWVNIPHITGLDVQLVVSSATCIGIDNATATAVVTPPGSNYVYQWNILPPDSNVVQVTGLAAGTFVSVVVTDTVSGCTGTASGIVGAHTTVDIAVTDVDILCAGGFGSATAVASNGTPQYTYTWFSNGLKIDSTASIDSLHP